jgi:carbonic anhydrase/acetyltransferase-like protein (isoleucine patch superfamily)
MHSIIGQHDVVALTEDLPQNGLVRGQVGTVVEQYSPDAFEVEFVDNSGHTYASSHCTAGNFWSFNTGLDEWLDEQ